MNLDRTAAKNGLFRAKDWLGIQLLSKLARRIVTCTGRGVLPHRCARAGVRIVTLASLVAASGVSQAQWRYQVGQQHQQQQANFCNDREDVSEIAGVFERYGARTGFSALSAAPNCATDARTFTPLRLVREVVITLDSGVTYSIRFIEVALASGTTSYLVTTRGFDAGN